MRYIFSDLSSCSCLRVRNFPLLIVIDECTLLISNCEQVCTDTEYSYNCSCHPGYSLSTDGHTCDVDCGGRLTAASGSFQTPDWPDSYPTKNFQCEWIIDVPVSGTIEFTIDESAFGITGRPPVCPTDHIVFFDGNSTNANTLNKICGLEKFYQSGLPVITTSSSVARVVFTGTDRSRGSSRVGVKVDYTAGGIYMLIYCCFFILPCSCS